MRVRRTVPQFTFILSASFVNDISLVSTGFFRFSSVLFGFRHILLQKRQQTAHFTQPQTRAINPRTIRTVLSPSCV